MASLAAIKAATQSRALEDANSVERQRDVLVLILSHLQSHGYVETATALLNETRSVDTLARYDLADNMDMHQVLREYEEYYKMKFGRRPVFCRLGNSNAQGVSDDASSRKQTRRKRRSTSTNNHGLQQLRDRNSLADQTVLPPLSTSQDHAAHKSSANTKSLRSNRKRAIQEETSDNEVDHQGITGFSLNSPKKKSSGQPHEADNVETRQMLKPMPSFHGDPELRSLALSIRRDIVQDCPGVSWNDVVGLDDAKRLLVEAMILPRKYPQLFTGLRSPWKSCLLYGLPGTGKVTLFSTTASFEPAL